MAPKSKQRKTAKPASSTSAPKKGPKVSQLVRKRRMFKTAKIAVNKFLLQHGFLKLKPSKSQASSLGGPAGGEGQPPSPPPAPDMQSGAAPVATKEVAQHQPPVVAHDSAAAHRPASPALSTASNTTTATVVELADNPPSSGLPVSLKHLLLTLILVLLTFSQANLLTQKQAFQPFLPQGPARPRVCRPLAPVTAFNNLKSFNFCPNYKYVFRHIVAPFQAHLLLQKPAFQPLLPQGNLLPQNASILALATAKTNFKNYIFLKNYVLRSQISRPFWQPFWKFQIWRARGCVPQKASKLRGKKGCSTFHFQKFRQTKTKTKTNSKFFRFPIQKYRHLRTKVLLPLQKSLQLSNTMTSHYFQGDPHVDTSMSTTMESSLTLDEKEEAQLTQLETSHHLEEASKAQIRAAGHIEKTLTLRR